MSVYRRFIRAKKGMSTIFGGLFFIILILMGFNVMLWGFIQYDSYNGIITTMSQRDQQATAENLVPINPGGTDFTGSCPSCSFNITVNNLGIAVSIARVYITNIAPVSSQCSLSPCTVDPPNLSNSNVPEGVIEHEIKVTGIRIDDGSGYKVVLASTRGRLFTFFYPWPAEPPPTGQLFQTNIGPLTVFFDFKSFNFTQGSQTASQTAWVTPTNTHLVFWLKVTNAATDSSIRLRVHSVLLFYPYSAGGLGSATPFYIVGPKGVGGTNYVNPNNMQVYNDVGGPFYDLAPADPSGPSSSTTVFFGSTTQGTATAQKLPNTEQTFLVFIGFYYNYKGNFQGQTVPFVAMRSCSAYPAASCY
jgi:hypothetical protein